MAMSVRAAGPSTAPATAPATRPAYTVAASEVLFVVTSTGEPRQWMWQGVTKAGYNCGFYVSETFRPGTYTLVEADVGGANAVSRQVTVQADPYREVELPLSADIGKLLSAAPDLTRFVLSPHATYTVSQGPSITRRLQIVAPAGGATVVVKPAMPAGGEGWRGEFAVNVWSTAAKVGLVNLNFKGDTGGRLNADGKTGLGAAYVPMGSLWAVNCDFEGLDFGVQCDSTPRHQANGVLLQGCRASTLYAQGLWIGGTQIDCDSCRFGPSKLEHPIRSSTVDPETNQIPTFIRICGNRFDGTHPKASSADPGKESLALREGRFFYVSGNECVGWGECGQGINTPGHYFGDYVFSGNRFTDPPTAPHTATLNVPRRDERAWPDHRQCRRDADRRDGSYAAGDGGQHAVTASCEINLGFVKL